MLFMITKFFRVYSSVLNLFRRCTRFDLSKKMSDCMITEYRKPTIINSKENHKLTVILLNNCYIILVIFFAWFR